MRRFPRAFALACLAAGAARAAVTLPYLLADHMVVQRGLPVHVWGQAAPGEAVAVSFRENTRAATADALGRWGVYLPPGEAGGPFELTVKGANAITLQDVLVGDVWIAAGQSNMEWPVNRAANAAAEVAAAKHPGIRLVRAMHKVSDFAQDNLVGQMWAPCSPDSVPNFSAVGYYFGRQLYEKYGVPIGLIQTAWGGTPADAWTSLRAISADASLMPVFAEWARMTRDHATALARYDLQLREWRAAEARARAEGKPASEMPLPPKGPGGPWEPGVLFNAMVAPITRYPIRGVVWYQGESNTAPERAPVYGRLFQAMIKDWRRAWGQGDFPFLFVQLANYRATPDSMWPELREAQRQALVLAHTAMAAAIDIGNPDNIHPANKQEAGRRLALAARAVAYGEKIEYSGPLFRQLTVEGSTVRVWFDHADSGLAARGGAPTGFEIAASDGTFVPAAARIEGATVVLRNSALEAPVRARYGWADNPRANVYNGEGLPAAPFRSE